MLPDKNLTFFSALVYATTLRFERLEKQKWQFYTVRYFLVRKHLWTQINVA